MNEPISAIVTPTGEPAKTRAARSPFAMLSKHLPLVLAISGIIGGLWTCAKPYFDAHYVTHEEFSAFKVSYYDTKREQTRLLTDIKVDVARVATSQEHANHDMDEIREDVRELRRNPAKR